jgi:hypothetical protein
MRNNEIRRRREIADGTRELHRLLEDYLAERS